ncbi:FeoA family protein [Marispirochaeta aestuarii]|uniref:FeoA family protein n=1 Tax=Marispirochaeta aestuarii TaxID=1963862 RepID=UPI0029C801CC|nr:FeoA family protein [Marispirochaeta aestuarii]
MVSLDSLKTGQTGIIHSLNGGSGFISRISAMGFTPETTVTMVSRRSWGPVLVYLRNTEVALGRREAGRITVRREDA